MTNETLATKPSPGSLGIPQDYDPESRIELIPKPGFPHHHYPRAIGHKFTPDGTVLRFPGNCLIAHLDPTSPAYQALQALHEDLLKQDFASLIALTPPSSYHMTVYECVSDQIRLRHSFPGDLPLDASKEECDAHMAAKLADFEPGLGPEGVGLVNVAGFDPLTDGISLKLQPDDEFALREMRNRLSKTLKMRHPGHDNYSWHMTLGYLLCHLAPAMKSKIEKYFGEWLLRLPESFYLGVPEFCTFEDMMHFDKVLYVGEQRK